MKAFLPFMLKTYLDVSYWKKKFSLFSSGVISLFEMSPFSFEESVLTDPNEMVAKEEQLESSTESQSGDECDGLRGWSMKIESLLSPQSKDGIASSHWVKFPVERFLCFGIYNLYKTKSGPF